MTRPLDPARDLRTDAVTQPTAEMWDAMRRAQPGWATAGEDDQVAELEQRLAQFMGKEAAVMVPTGTAANLAALMSCGRPGDQVILEERCHILWSERGGLAAVCGLLARPLPGRPVCPTGDEVDAAIRQRWFGHDRRTALVCLESSHNAAGGVAARVEDLRAVRSAARAHNVPIHLDGARLLNAAVALEAPVVELTREVDSVMLNLNKGLSAPAGAVLCGSAAFVAAARGNLARVGAASLHQAGIWAAAALVALDTMVARLADDHRVARRLADGLSRLDGLRVDPARVETNIVVAELEPPLTSRSLVAALRERGVGAYLRSERSVRFVTHRHVGAADADAVVESARSALAAAGRPAR